MDNTLNKKKLMGLIFICLGLVIGIISDPIENSGNSLTHAILAMVIVLALPLWFILISKIDKHFTTTQIKYVWLSKFTIACIAFGVFLGRAFLLAGSGLRIDNAVILASPFLGVSVGTLVAIHYERRSSHGVKSRSGVSSQHFP